ncbi:unnamed protein product, partial [Meganyctiphanes norvegica]
MADKADVEMCLKYNQESNSGSKNIGWRYQGTVHDMTIVWISITLRRSGNITDIPGRFLMVSIWDTAGQERFNSLVRSFYRETHGFIIVYDITDRTSFQNIIKWHDEIKKNADDDVDKLIVGNKCDLKDIREVSYQEAKSLAENLGIQYMETSAKDGLNVDVILETLAASIAQRITPESTSSDDDNITLSNATNTNSQTKKGCRC